ncbi:MULTISPECIES: DUF2333 family protein [unclassified Rhizobium]|uniref:DUF2333 family protein n=1 Tax=unclassified Rhizobium TaxID=2613769 RepID=UPI00160022D2|nr:MULTISPECIES: DUF2333 family protein [unclassified Rhizobium]MBB1250381.1 DUF2333 family protein [Rhizobium sp. G21]MCV3764897.1 DUF2333 family protein [Rhizobium sp. TRM95796]
MLDPIIAFFQRIFSAIGRGIGMIIAWILFPFLSASRWYASRGLIIKAVVGLFLLILVGAYGHFIWMTQVWSGFNPDYVAAYKLNERKFVAGQDISGADSATPTACQTSGIVDVAADLIDQEVNQNAWISSMPLYKLGLFGIDWDHTPWLDNKASFQRGVNQTVRRTTVELVDSLARVRGTSGINNTLQLARSNMQYDEGSWYVSFSPFGFRTPTPDIYRQAVTQLKQFNTELGKCQSVFDGRADNLLEFLDRIANDLGSTSAMLRERSENYNAGWFDTRADDRFWFAYGQLYGYYGILTAARADFGSVIRERNLAPLWNEMLKQFRAALNIQPAIISNGREDGWIMPTHLATQGFYILRARSNLIEVRDVLDR